MSKAEYERSKERLYQMGTLTALGLGLGTPIGQEYLEKTDIEYEPLGLYDDSALRNELAKHANAMESWERLSQRIQQDESVTAKEFQTLDATLQAMSNDTTLSTQMRKAIKKAKKQLHRADYLADGNIKPGTYQSGHRSELAEDAIAVVEDADKGYRGSIENTLESDAPLDAAVSAVPLMVIAYGMGKMISKYESEIRHVINMGTEKAKAAYTALLGNHQ